MFYERDDTNERLASLRASHPGCRILKKDIYQCSPKRTALSRMVADFARSQFDNNLNRQLQESAEGHLQLSPREIIRESLKAEEMALQSREEIAEQNLLTNLKSQKYG